MAILEFPPVESADAHGLLAIGGDLSVESLLLAYRNGIFPWPVDDSCLTWFAPPKRALLFTEAFRPSASLRRTRNKQWARFAINRNFAAVIEGCQELENRSDQDGTWITEELRQGYINLHTAGHAHSFECYEKDQLVGGVYGVLVGGAFSAESMFYRVPDASKLALWFMVEFLSQYAVPWIDVQVLNPFSEKMGAIAVSRNAFMERLKERVDISLGIPWSSLGKDFHQL